MEPVCKIGKIRESFSSFLLQSDAKLIMQKVIFPAVGTMGHTKREHWETKKSAFLPWTVYISETTTTKSSILDKNNYDYVFEDLWIS